MNHSHQEWLWIDSGQGEAALNMAVDEMLLEITAQMGMPVLRFYGWTEPAASFGYFQRYGEVASMTPLRPLVRRPTGGGIVPHDSDWTYSAAFPSGHPWYDLSAVESYREIHKWVSASLQRLGVAATLAPQELKTGPGLCFQGHERYDLLYAGRKIAGAAQRRTRKGLLIQGSVQPPAQRLERPSWQDEMLAVAASLGVKWAPFGWKTSMAEEAKRLADEKFGAEAFIRKR